jgi:SPP1 family phage portal protein
MLRDFELATEISDALNLLASDSISDVENVIKSLLIIMNAEITADEAEKARKNRILQLIGQPGQNVDAKFIYQQLDALGIQNLREYLEEAYKTVVGIPDRKTRSGGGGDTGDAVKLRDGWADIEIVARIKEQYFKIAKKKQLAVAIKILKLLGQVSDGFTLEDIDIKMPRNKHDNIQSKAQSYSTLMSTNTIAPEDALSMADMTNDITGVVERGKKYKEENQDNSYVNSYSNRRNYSNNPQDVDNNVDNSTQE